MEKREKRLRMTWKKVTIESLADSMTDGPFGSDLKTCHYTEKKEARIIQLSNVGEDGWLDENVKYTTFDHAKTLSRCVVEPGNVIIAKMMPAGRAIICPNHEAMFIQGSDVVKFIPNNQIDSKFFVYMTKQKDYLAQIEKNTQGSTRARTSISKLKTITLVIPTDIAEQKRIAKILSTCDEVIFNTQKVIKKYKAVKQGLMQDLFTRGLTEDGNLRPSYKEAPELYKQSELGVIPKDWEVNSLSNVTTYVDYRGKTPFKTSNGIQLITAKNVKDGYIDYNISREYIEKDKYESVMTRGLPRIGDVLFTTEAPVGNVAQINIENIALAQRIIKFRGNSEKIHNKYLLYSFLSDYFRRILLAESTGSTAQGIKGSRLHQLKIKIPSFNEQQAISKRLSKIDSLIQKEESILSKYRKIKTGLMDKLLSN